MPRGDWCEFQTLAEASKIASSVARTGFVPDAYKGKPAEIVAAWMHGHELGLPPMASLKAIGMANGRPFLYGDGLVAVCQKHPQWGDCTFPEDLQTPEKAVCVAWRRNGEKHTYTFTKDDAKAAGLWGRRGPWTQYPQRMLRMRARGFALRDLYADALCGMVDEFEARDMPVQSAEYTVIEPGNEGLKSRLKGE